MRPLALVRVVVLALVVAGAVDVRSAGGASAGRYGWPLAAPHPVVRGFSAPTTPYGPGHRGVDVGGVAGEAVFAAGDGTVVFAGAVGGRTVVSVAHGSGLRTTYEPLEPVVGAGAAVRRGERIGTLLSGHAGCPVAACLHWGARRGADYVNPLRLVTAGRVRLLPLAPAGGSGFADGGRRPSDLGGVPAARKSPGAERSLVANTERAAGHDQARDELAVTKWAGAGRDRVGGSGFAGGGRRPPDLSGVPATRKSAGAERDLVTNTGRERLTMPQGTGVAVTAGARGGWP